MISPATSDKNEKTEEKEIGLVEDKLSNVSTTYSSKEKALEEDINIPPVSSLKTSKSLTRLECSPEIFQINFLLPNETISIEIFQVRVLINLNLKIILGGST